MRDEGGKASNLVAPNPAWREKAGEGFVQNDGFERHFFSI
jgi:hypothetical protein